MKASLLKLLTLATVIGVSSSFAQTADPTPTAGGGNGVGARLREHVPTDVTLPGRDNLPTEMQDLVNRFQAHFAKGTVTLNRTAAEVGADFPEIERDAMYVDAMAMDLVRRPERYAVIVTSNLFGDIVSDLAAELTGGLGLAPSANLHPGRHALFEPVHGSAPDIAGTGKANPFGAVRCVALMLDHFGYSAAGERVERAVAAAIARGRTTVDMGGSFSTAQVGEWLAEHVSQGAVDEN